MLLQTRRPISWHFSQNVAGDAGKQGGWGMRVATTRAFASLLFLSRSLPLSHTSSYYSTPLAKCEMVVVSFYQAVIFAFFIVKSLGPRSGDTPGTEST